MNPASQKEAEHLISQTKEYLECLKSSSDRPQVVFCPPAIFLARLVKKIGWMSLGAQNIGWEEAGAFTGEMSASMIKSSGASFCLVGHSERRIFFGENYGLTNKKIKLCLEKKITPILCVGENLEEKNSGKTRAVIESQLKTALKEVSLLSLKNIIVAYEPVWAISSVAGAKAEKPDSVLGASILVRRIVANLYDPGVARELPVIYGGSVNYRNAAGYLKDTSLQGLLVGSASLSPFSFAEIIKKSLNIKDAC